MMKALCIFLFAGCGCDDKATGPDPDEGPIEDTLEPADRINWPGLDRANGRVIPFIRGFGNGRPAAYWFLGFASRKTSDSFWFCREGDEACPLDEHRRLDWDTIVGNPVFTQIPGLPDFSPFWQMWKVTVPADFEPNSVKNPDTLNRLKDAGDVTVEPLMTDFGDYFGEAAGVQETVLHCALVLAGTELEANGGEMPDGRGPSLVLQNRPGWFENHSIEFVDFSPSDGVFPEATDSENRPLMRFANIYIHWRSCDADPNPPICELENYAYTDRRPVSERGLGQDITGDGDSGDTNNVLGAMPCELLSLSDPDRPPELPYSPLWGPLAVSVLPESDSGLSLIDYYGDQALSDVQSADMIFQNVQDEACLEPVPMNEDETGNPIPGNEGRVFFNCPNPVPAEFAPFPCAS